MPPLVPPALPRPRRPSMLLRTLAEMAGRRRAGTFPALRRANLPSLHGRIEILRDVRGVPHVYADEERDLYAALGFLQAADRFVLMDLLRYLGAGRVVEKIGNVPVPVPAELLGGGGLAAVDRFLAPLGFEEACERDAARLSPRAAGCLESYTDGVNAALRAMDGMYPAEYLLLAAPRPWRVSDTLLCQRTSGFVVTIINLDNELTFDAVRDAVGDELARLVYPEAPWENVPASYRPGPGEPPEPPLHLPAGGSNNWAIAGSRTASGAPIFANDPHVPAIPLPTYWYHAHLECPAYRVQGGVFPGAPLFGFGHNGHLAWGCTTAFRDAWDLFRVHRAKGDPTLYRTPGGFGRIRAHRAVRRARFGGDVEIVWESCEHGVIHRGWKHGDGVDLALRFAPADDATYVEGYLDLVASRTVEEHQAAVAKMNEGPFDFNHVYAHRDGHVGWEMFGKLPRRTKDGLFVRDAHDPEAQWDGFLCFEENPKILNPASGIVVTANAATDLRNFASIASHVHFEPRRRQDRITERIAARTDHTLETSSEIHADVTATYAGPVRDALVAMLRDGVEPGSREARALETLAAWDLRFDVESAGGAIFFFLQQAMVPRVFRPLLGDAAGRRFCGGRRAVPCLQRVIVDAADPLRARIEAAAGRTLAEIARESLGVALARIARVHGDAEPERFAWGRIQRAKLGGVLAQIPGIGRFFEVLDAPFPGEDYTVNPNRGIDDGELVRVLVTGTSRFVCDLAKPDEAIFSHSSGPRGDLGSLWHANLCEPWSRFETFRSALWKPHEVPDVLERLEGRW